MNDRVPKFEASKRAQKRRHRPSKPQLLSRHALDGRSNAARTFDRLVAGIQGDLGGRDHLSSIELVLVEAFAGSAVLVDHLNVRLLRGEEIDISEHAKAVSAMVRVATRLGTRRRQRDVTVLDPLDYAPETSS